MKIFIGSNPPDQTYTSVGFRRTLDDFCQDAECTEINAPTMLDFIQQEKRGEFVQHLVSKMRHGATLVIGGTDLISLSLAVFNKTLTNEQANVAIFGPQNEPPKTSLSCLEDLRRLLIANGLRITKQIPGLKMLIVATRD